MSVVLGGSGISFEMLGYLVTLDTYHWHLWYYDYDHMILVIYKYLNFLVGKAYWALIAVELLILNRNILN